MMGMQTEKDYLVNVTWTEGYMINGDGVVTGDNRGKYSELVRVTPGKSYLLTGTAGKSSPLWDRVHGYDENGNWAEQIARADWIDTFSLTITIPNNCRYIRVSTEIVTQISMYDAR